MKLLISLLVFVLVSDLVSSHEVEECSQQFCESDIGYFNKESMGGVYYKEIRRQQREIIVLKFSDLQDASYAAFIYVSTTGYDSTLFDVIRGDEDRVVVVDALRVAYVMRSSASFTVQYIAGCDLVTELQDYPASLNVHSHCSLFVPRIYEGSSRQHTALTAVFLKNVPDGVNVELTDVVTGENILNVDNATDFDLAMIPKSNGTNFKSYSDKKLTHASSIYLLTFENFDDADLSNTTFDYYALSEYSLSCFNQERDCNYEFLTDEEYEKNCNTKKCPVFEKIIDLIPSSGKVNARQIYAPQPPDHCREKKDEYFGKVPGGFNKWRMRVCLRTKYKPNHCNTIQRKDPVETACVRMYCKRMKSNFCTKKRLFSIFM